jgi:hypothetical protein
MPRRVDANPEGSDSLGMFAAGLSISSNHARGEFLIRRCCSSLKYFWADYLTMLLSFKYFKNLRDMATTNSFTERIERFGGSLLERLAKL